MSCNTSSPVAMPISPFCNILQSVAALSTSSNCPHAPYLLQRLSRPHATPSPLQVAMLSTSPVCPPALHVLQHAHVRPISCNTLRSALPLCAHVLQHLTVCTFPACACLATPCSPSFPRVRMPCNTSQSALPPRVHALQHLTVRPSPACACLATPHSLPFPRVRMSCNTSQSALPPSPCAPYVLQHVSLALIPSPHSLHLPCLPACAYVLPISPSCKM